MAEADAKKKESTPVEQSEKSCARGVLDSTLHVCGCVGVGVLGAMIDGPAIVGINFMKSPVFLWKGWKVTMAAKDDYGPCLTTTMMCVWPLRVMYSMGSSVVYGLGKGLKGGIIAYQENSLEMGFRHIIAAVAEYDEFTNDVTLMREGSCLPRPAYTSSPPKDEDGQVDLGASVQGIKEVRLEKLVEYMKSEAGRERAGKELAEEGLVPVPTNGNTSTSSGNGEQLQPEPVALLLFSFLLNSDDQKKELVYDPLETLQQQIKDAKLTAVEQVCLKNLVLVKDMDSTEEKLQQLEPIRKATVQAFGRRIRGFSGFVSGHPTFKKSYAEFVSSISAVSHA